MTLDTIFMKDFWNLRRRILAGLIFVILSRPVDVHQLAFLSGQGPRWPAWPQLGCQGPKDFYSVYLVGPSTTKYDDLEKERLNPLNMKCRKQRKQGMDSDQLYWILLGSNWYGFLWSESWANKWIWRHKIVYCMQSCYLQPPYITCWTPTGEQDWRKLPKFLRYISSTIRWTIWNTGEWRWFS